MKYRVKSDPKIFTCLKSKFMKERTKVARTKRKSN